MEQAGCNSDDVVESGYAAIDYGYEELFCRQVGWES